ncbi:MAG: hypothetical protein KF767_01180 [Bdellovibrionaceae bacterium]|nr:hypothetical protein [Pseudobdellovibrionaceae bacterium]
MMRWRVLLISILAFSLPLIFQNCTGFDGLDANLSSLSLAESQSPGGNGEGYDGKIYNLILVGGVCADGDPVRARILVRNGVGIMIRQNCRDLSADERFEVPLVFNDAEKRILVYEGEEYLLQYVQFQEMKAAAAGADFTAIGTVWNAAPGHLPVVARLNDAGKPSWVRTYDHDFAGRSLIVTSLTSSSDGLLLSASPADLNLATAFQSREPALLVKLDDGGLPLSALVYGADLPERHKLRFARVMPLGAGRLLVGASLTVFAESTTSALSTAPERRAAGLVWLRADGRIEAQRWFEDMVLTDLLPLSDGTLLLSGLGNGQPIYVKVNSSGEVLWTRQIAMQSESVLATDDGGFIVAGSTEFSSTGRSQALVLRLDSAGDLSWSRSYGTANESGLAVIASLVARPGGGFYALGFADRSGRTATYYRLGSDGSLLDHAKFKPGFSARWKKALLTNDGALWGSLVNSDFTRVENSLNEVLVRLHPESPSLCTGCVRNDDDVSITLSPTLTTPALTVGAEVLSPAFKETPLRARSLGYPLFISP